MEAAGLSDEQGRLAVGGTSIGTPPVPTEVELRDGWLAWRARSRANARSGTDVRDMLDTFIRIKSDDGVRRFAERFGVLLLCEEHGLPSGHVTQEPTPELLLGGCWPRLADDDQFRLEPLEGWHRLVAEARTMVSIGASLHRGTVPAPERWDILGELPWVGLLDRGIVCVGEAPPRDVRQSLARDGGSRAGIPVVGGRAGIRGRGKYLPAAVAPACAGVVPQHLFSL